mgnify:CR=1 FL=1
MNGRLEKRSEPATNINDVDSKMNYQTLRCGLLMNPSYERPYANDNPNYPAYNENSYLYNPAAATKDIMGEHTDIWRVFQGNWDITYTPPVKGLSAKQLIPIIMQDKREKNFIKAIIYILMIGKTMCIS